MTKRDIWEGAVPASEYYKTDGHKKPSLAEAVRSQSGYTIDVPKEDRRDVDEQVIQSEIMQFLRDRGAWCHKAKAVNLVGTGVLAPTQQGVPDILACYDGVFIALEAKAAKQGKRVSGEQVAQISNIIQAGGVAAVVWSVEQVERLLEAIDDGVWSAH
jgi:Holliday junction resolvase